MSGTTRRMHSLIITEGGRLWGTGWHPEGTAKDDFVSSIPPPPASPSILRARTFPHLVLVQPTALRLERLLPLLDIRCIESLDIFVAARPDRQDPATYWLYANDGQPHLNCTASILLPKLPDDEVALTLWEGLAVLEQRGTDKTVRRKSMILAGTVHKDYPDYCAYLFLNNTRVELGLFKKTAKKEDYGIATRWLPPSTAA